MTNEKIADRIVEMIVHDLMNHDELAGQIWDEVPRRIRTAIETLWRHNTYAMLPSPAVEPAAEPSEADLVAAARVALIEMCRTTAPRISFTDAVDRLDAALSAVKPVNR